MNLLKGFARGGLKKIVIQLSYPADEVGNHLISLDQLDESGVNPWSDTLTEEDLKVILEKPRIHLPALTTSNSTKTLSPKKTLLVKLYSQMIQKRFYIIPILSSSVMYIVANVRNEF